MCWTMEYRNMRAKSKKSIEQKVYEGVADDEEKRRVKNYLFGADDMNFK